MLSVAALLLLASCASGGHSTPFLTPLDTLPADAALCVYVPVQAHKALVSGVMQQLAGGMREKDIERIVSRTTAVYVAAGAKDGSVQLAAVGYYSQAAVSVALSKKNGWKKHIIAAGASLSAPTPTEAAYLVQQSYVYYERSDLPLMVWFPHPWLACVATNIPSLFKSVENYDKAFFCEGSRVTASSVVYGYLSEPQETEMRFGSFAPAALFEFLAEKQENAGVFALLPKDMLTLRSVYGSVRAVDAENASLSVTLELNDARTVKAAAAMLKLALFSSGVAVSTGESSVTISDYPLALKQFFNGIYF